MIKDNRDGTYTVKFKGTKEEYTVGASELTSNPDWASGDLDIRILEIAAQKYYSCIGAPIESGGNPYAALELLLGTGDQWQNLARCYASKPEPQKIKELLDNKNIVMTASISPFSKLWGLIVKEIPDNADYKNDIATAHAYAVVDVDNNNIYLKNPWDTGKTIAIPFDIFKEYWGIVQYTEIK